MGGCVSSLDSAMNKLTGSTVKSVTVGKTDVNIIKKPALDTLPINLVIPLFDKTEVETAILEVDKDDQTTIEEKINKVLDNPVKEELKKERIKVVPCTSLGLEMKNVIFVYIENRPSTSKDTLISTLVKIFETAEKNHFKQITIPRLSKSDQLGAATPEQQAQWIWEACCSHLSKVQADGHHLSDVNFAVKEENYLKALSNTFQPLTEPEKTDKTPGTKAS